MQLLGPWTDSGAISASAGGKARGLHILHNSGFAVPEWAVLGTDVFDAFATGAGLDEQIAEFAAGGPPLFSPPNPRRAPPRAPPPRGARTPPQKNCF
ncbi:hypothetical protein [Nocardia cyriacigeorgica]|uniref:hypothetical protein n=1 Tax=Nocardia cyriacigeorgica TaxID=135487 RepID=UPI0024572DDD|nr:hypothetical protein [Nocardia cyriacigeorgica]